MTDESEQLSFDDVPHDIPHARVTDPGTSWASARKTEEDEGTTTRLRPGTQKHLALRLIREEPRTSAQVVRASGKPGIWKRVSDLKNAELVFALGEVWDMNTQRQVSIWATTPLGTQVLHRLDRGESVKL